MFVYTISSKISQAMNISNQYNQTDFTLVDCAILCLAKSFHKTESDFYMSNQQLAVNLLTSERTIQRAVNRLCGMGLLKKEIIRVNTTSRRKLIFQVNAVQAFISDMNRVENRVGMPL